MRSDSLFRIPAVVLATILQAAGLSIAGWAQLTIRLPQH
jgi:hypothetical protein